MNVRSRSARWDCIALGELIDLGELIGLGLRIDRLLEKNDA